MKGDPGRLKRKCKGTSEQDCESSRRKGAAHILALLSKSTGLPLLQLSSVGRVLLVVLCELLFEVLVLGTGLPGSLKLFGRVRDLLLETFPRSALESRGQTGEEVGRRLLRGAVKSHVDEKGLQIEKVNEGQYESTKRERGEGRTLAL